MQVVHVLLCVFIQHRLFLCWILWCWFEPPELLFKTHISYTERVCSAQSKQHTPDTHTPSNTQKSHFGIHPKWPHVIFPFHSSDFSCSQSVHLSNTHTHEVQQHKRWGKHHSRPSCLVTVNPVNGTTVCFLSDSTHLTEWDVIHCQTAAGLTGAF